MWLRRWLALNVILIFQLLFLGQALDRVFYETPTPEIAWTEVFSPLIFYFAIATLLLFGRYYTLVAERIKRRNFVSVEAMQRDGGNNATAIVTKTELDRVNRLRRTDAIIDTLLFAPLLVFFILVLVKLGDDDSDDSWFPVFIPLILFHVILFVMLTLGAIRTCGEERLAESDLPVKSCCRGAFGGVLFCCKEDTDRLDSAEMSMMEKKGLYNPDSEFHSLPTAFLCTPSLVVNIPELVINWLLYIGAFVMIIVAFEIPIHIDAGVLTMTRIFVILLIDIGLLIASSLLMFGLLCVDPRTSNSEAAQRINIAYKFGKATIVFIFALLIGIFILLLDDELDNNDDTSWHEIFAPLYVLLGIAVFISSCIVKSYHKQRADMPIVQTVMQAQTRAHATISTVKRALNAPPAQPSRETSLYGVVS